MKMNRQDGIEHVKRKSVQFSKCSVLHFAVKTPKFTAAFNKLMSQDDIAGLHCPVLHEYLINTYIRRVNDSLLKGWL